MRTRAAVLYDSHGPFKVEEVELDPPRDREVQVRLAASGLCHSDYHAITGDIPVPFPMICGHEGAGVVEAIGPGVTSVEPGDRVVLSFMPACGRCRFCAQGRSNLCDQGAGIMIGQQMDGTYRFSSGGTGIGQLCLLGTFAEHTVVPEISVVKIDSDISLKTASLVGCGVPTGFGAAVNRAKVRAGETVVVFGAGGIGMNAIQGAAVSGARVVIAVEPNAEKRKLAIDVFGASHAIDPHNEDVLDRILDITWNRGADVSIIATGLLENDILQVGLKAMAKGGRAVCVSIPPIDSENIPMTPFELVLYERQIMGTVYGTCNPYQDIHNFLELYAAGRLKLNELITTEYTLDQINEGYADMLAGRNVRGVIVYDDSL